MGRVQEDPQGITYVRHGSLQLLIGKGLGSIKPNSFADSTHRLLREQWGEPTLRD